MALTTTTASAAITATAREITVASATGFAAGYWVRVEDELMQVAQNYSSGTTIPVRRGLQGTVVSAHAVTSNVTVGTGADFANPTAAVVAPYPVAGRTRRIVSYGAAGAISLPTPGEDVVAIINGTDALTMTLAVPTKDMDGNILTIISNGKAAHTVTLATAVGNAGAGYTVGTFPSGGQTSLQLMACNGIWCSLPAPWEGTVTAIDVSIS